MRYSDPVAAPAAVADGLWRSLVAHLTGGQGVAGSNPVSPTMKAGATRKRVAPAFFLFPVQLAGSVNSCLAVVWPTYFRNFDVLRSARILPFVWHVGQY